MEGDNSQVEMKLSSEIDEETGGNGVGGHLNHNSNRTPYVAQKFGRTPKNLCFMAATIFLIFIIGKREKETEGKEEALFNLVHSNLSGSLGICPGGLCVTCEKVEVHCSTAILT